MMAKNAGPMKTMNFFIRECAANTINNLLSVWWEPRYQESAPSQGLLHQAVHHELVLFRPRLPHSLRHPSEMHGSNNTRQPARGNSPDCLEKLFGKAIGVGR
jgi:hypothetical protein